MKIDIFPHIIPLKYKQALYQKLPAGFFGKAWIEAMPTLTDLDYYRLFYADTAIYRNTPALMCCYEFFGAGHMLFGTDMPYDSQFGFRQVREVIESIDGMEISAAEKKLIYEDNARKLLRLPI